MIFRRRVTENQDETRQHKTHRQDELRLLAEMWSPERVARLMGRDVPRPVLLRLVRLRERWTADDRP